MNRRTYSTHFTNACASLSFSHHFLKNNIFTIFHDHWYRWILLIILSFFSLSIPITHQVIYSTQMSETNGKAPQSEESTLNYYYISSKTQQDALKSHKYNGSDNSLIYKYVLSPLAEFLVQNFVPENIAPNTITIFGLFWVVMSYWIFALYCPNLDDAPEATGTGGGWIFFFGGMSILIYQTLDNMDGKQARRTKASSPLGLLFDHGCDAFNCGLGSSNFLCCWAVSSSLETAGALYSSKLCMGVIVLCPMIAFYVTTWEEYHTGKLILPIINGPSEGLLLNALQMFMAAYFGTKVFHGSYIQQNLFEPYLPAKLYSVLMETFGHEGSDGIEILRDVDALSLILLVLCIREFTSKSVEVSSKYGIQSLYRIIPLLTLVTLYFGVYDNFPLLFSRYPRVSIHVFSMLFTEMTTALMLDNITHSQYNFLCRPTFIPLILFFAFWRLTGRFSFIGEEEEEQQQMLEMFWVSYATGLTVYLFIKARLIIHELCCILGIWCFDITTPHPNVEKQKKR